jgi:type II secretory pathway component PulJ
MRRVSARQSAHSARRGITIIEVMIVVSCVAVLLGLCAVSIQLLMKLNTDIQGRYSESVALERLGRQLRDDAHASRSVAMIEDAKKVDRPRGLRLVLEPEHSAVYEFGDGGVVRTEMRAGKNVRHERFTLARGAGARFELRDEASRRLVALVVTRPPGKSQAEPPRPFELVALQGKDRVEMPGQQGSKPK